MLVHFCHRVCPPLTSFRYFSDDTATTEIYTLSLHDALPISRDDPRQHLLDQEPAHLPRHAGEEHDHATARVLDPDRKSTRLNSSHRCISYAVFCLKKKKKLLAT